MIYFALFAGVAAFLCGCACIIEDVIEENKYYQNF